MPPQLPRKTPDAATPEDMVQIDYDFNEDTERKSIEGYLKAGGDVRDRHYMARYVYGDKAVDNEIERGSDYLLQRLSRHLMERRKRKQHHGKKKKRK